MIFLGCLALAAGQIQIFLCYQSATAAIEVGHHCNHDRRDGQDSSCSGAEQFMVANGLADLCSGLIRHRYYCDATAVGPFTGLQETKGGNLGYGEGPAALPDN